MCVMTNDLIGKRVKLTEEFATEYYYDKPYVNKVLIVVDLILSYKEDDIKKEFGYNRVVLKDDDGNIYDDDIEEWGVEEVTANETTFEVCPHCNEEVQLESKFEAQVCPSCNTIILPCSICPVNDNCLNCPLSNHSVEDVYNKHFNKMLEGTGYTACFVETSELYGEDDDEVDEDDPYYMMPMYEAHIEDENEDELDDTWTGRYCEAASVAEELEAFISELLEQKEDSSDEGEKQIIGIQDVESSQAFEIVEELIEKFNSGRLIHFDQKSALVLWYHTSKNEYIVHNVYKGLDKWVLENGNYLDDADDAMLAFLKRKGKKLSISVNLSEEDIEDLRSGSVFNWTYPDESGIEVDVELFQGDEEA